jgi:hypothetical protein
MPTRRFSHVAPPPVRVVVAMGAVLAVLLALVVTAGRAGAADGATISVSPTSDLAVVDASVTVTGSGFAGTPAPGVYVAVGPADVKDNADWFADASYYQGAAFVPGATIVGGAFTTTLTVDAEFTSKGTAVDCRVTPCAVFTWAAHGSAVRSQDTSASLTFVGDTTTTTSTTSTTSTSTTSTTSTSTTSTSTSTTTSTVPSSTTTTSVPAPEPDHELAVTGGYLDWGVKASFRTYVTTVAAGSISPGDGATVNGDGTFHFPGATGTASADGETFGASFDGSVHFTGHDGALDLSIAGVEVHADGDDGALVADVTSTAMGSSTPTTYSDVEVAVLDLSAVSPGAVDLTVTWAGIEAALTEAGVPAFGEFYPAGAELDPLTVVLDVEATTVAPGGGSGGGPDAATLDKSVLGPGDALTVSGGGFTPGEQVEVWLHSDPQWVGTTVAGASGDVAFTFDLPDDLPAGLHHVELIGVTSGRVLSTAEFTVAAAGAAGAVSTTGSLPYTGGDSVPVGAAGIVLVLVGIVLASGARLRGRTRPTA